ncbi:adenosine kinase-like isoform X2 [Portunus trituberculatus]|uniref:adenosine kinase-like isoform X2 n=1 Tax=Portunus trituberculatus TaxID=210409 RepID=UPI001E1D1F34|nr:adenosine kinase-like isoform X2 [Portunus trituberculatus]
MDNLIEPRQNGETNTTTTTATTTNDGGGTNNTTNTTDNTAITTAPLLVSFGNPLLDITAVVKDNELHHRFSLPIDGQLEVEDTQRPVFSHVMQEYPVEYTAGGCALNSSRVFCWVLGEPRRVVFVGGIGKDEAARKLSNIVEESGVITRFVKVEGQPTGVCVALVLGACRCLCADIGAAATCLPQHVFAPHLTPVLEEAKFIYVEGYFITHSFPAALQIAQFAQRRGKTLVFNLCGSYVCERHGEELRRLLPYVDILFGFEEEYRTLDAFVDVAALSADHHHDPASLTHDLLLVLQAIRGQAPVLQDGTKPTAKAAASCPDATLDIMASAPGCGGGLPNGDLATPEREQCCPGIGDTHCSTPGTGNGHCGIPTPSTNCVDGTSSLTNGTTGQAANGHSLSSAKQRLVVVTKGPSPLLYCQGGAVRQRCVPPIAPEDIVDTTGAGDSFVGGFLAALSHGRPLAQCLDCGVWTAQQLLRQKGCTLPPHPAEFLLATE